MKHSRWIQDNNCKSGMYRNSCLTDKIQEGSYLKEGGYFKKISKMGWVVKEIKSVFEPPHDKTNKTAWAPVWSESSLSAWRTPGSLATYWVHSEDSDQTGRMPRLIGVFAGRTCHFVGFVMRRLIWWSLNESSQQFSVRTNLWVFIRIASQRW